MRDEKKFNIVFTNHAAERVKNRGCTKDEVSKAIKEKMWKKAERGKLTCSKVFPFNSEWFDRYYKEKEVVPIFIKEDEVITVITVYTFFRGGK